MVTVQRLIAFIQSHGVEVESFTDTEITLVERYFTGPVDDFELVTVPATVKAVRDVLGY